MYYEVARVGRGGLQFYNSRKTADTCHSSHEVATPRTDVRTATGHGATGGPGRRPAGGVNW